jgi:alpha-methylacyl-CoA racemase
MKSPLSAIKLIEFAGLAPGPFAGLLLSDLGANVIRIDRPAPSPVADSLSRGKKSVCIDIRKRRGAELVTKLTDTADVVIDPFRPGVLEKMGLGPDVLCTRNPRLIYARLTGFGQTGKHLIVRTS